MSHLHPPRIHFGGLFFTNPATINNYEESYDPSVRLEDGHHRYLGEGGDDGPAGWNPTGTAQLWLEECRVLSAVTPTGRPLFSPEDDAIVGATVESPSPLTPRSDPRGRPFDIAKMVDLDPEQQGRPAVYGLRIFLSLKRGGGFSGLLSTPECRFLRRRVDAGERSWSGIGTWMGHMRDVVWLDGPRSPFLKAFRAACRRGIAVRLSVDLHQNSNDRRLTPGDMFCYGRVHGAMGPVRAGELEQVVPGRLLRPPTAAPAAREAREKEAPRHHRLHDGGPARPHAPSPWNEVPVVGSTAKNRSILHLDLAGAPRLEYRSARDGPTSNGKFVVNRGITVATASPSGTITPLTHGEIDLTENYVLLRSTNKRCYLLRGGGVVDIPLERHEVAAVRRRPLVITVDGDTVLEEPADGEYVDTAQTSFRLEAGDTATFQVMARRRGAPLRGVRPVRWSGKRAVRVEFLGVTNIHGIATVRVSASRRPPPLPKGRRPIDSLIYFVAGTGPSGRPIGDYGHTVPNPPISVVLFKPYRRPSNPTWKRDVQPVLAAYARLYPGMKAILDIGNEATVLSSASKLYDRMSASFDDPAYMPVTRDIAPAKIAMILRWLESCVSADPRLR